MKELIQKWDEFQTWWDDQGFLIRTKGEKLPILIPEPCFKDFMDWLVENPTN